MSDKHKYRIIKLDEYRCNACEEIETYSSPPCIFIVPRPSITPTDCPYLSGSETQWQKIETEEHEWLERG